MSTIECAPDEKGTRNQLERVRFFPRQLVTAADLTQEQNYVREKQRRHNRLLHGWGIVCGLEVKANPISGAPLNVTICAGYALSPQGDEISVPAEIPFDLGQCIAGTSAPCHSPCAPVAPGAVDPAKDFYIAIKYAECPSHPVRVPPVGCGCDETACEYSRIREGFAITCLGSLPDSYDSSYQVLNKLCDAVNGSRVVACPTCPDSPWIALARIHVNGTVLDTPALDCRRVLLSTAMIQAYLREQCA